MITSVIGHAVSRRRFLITGGAALVVPHLITGCATTRKPPSEQIAVGIIGSGGQGTNNTNSFLAHSDCRVVAACDVDQKHLSDLVGVVNKYYNNNDCKAYHDYRELLARGDIDAVMIAVPDHWHELVAVEAARRKKDIYGEKPLARTIAEQQAIVRAVVAHDCIWQTGSWQRSVGTFHKAAEIVRNGLIGKITRVEVGLPAGDGDAARNAEFMMPSEAPPELDYDTWIGPSRMMLYVRARVHGNWRWNYNTGGGQLMDWVGHHCDIAHWGLGFDNTGPMEIEGHGEFPPQDAVWNTSTKYRIELKYPEDVAMTIAGGYEDIRSGTKWIGTDGWVWVDRDGFDASNQDWRDMKQLPESERKIKLIISTDHTANFLDSVKSRKPTITPVETAHHSTIPGHLGLISMLVGRKLKWDAQQELILDDPEASELLSRPFRPPWKLV
ncbi:MAG TPA: Gfo/Idh/MocA family oxidoreductase [Candidatus Baltobacteraceae bacterium]|jgi:predicted dehydrogenase|nr:Gfo/Idh/MocA family oxidoreductase [Candidatus Baltobacteraceae bacterium]